MKWYPHVHFVGDVDRGDNDDDDDNNNDDDGGGGDAQMRMIVISLIRGGVPNGVSDEILLRPVDDRHGSTFQSRFNLEAFQRHKREFRVSACSSRWDVSIHRSPLVVQEGRG